MVWIAAAGIARAGRFVRYTADYYRAFAHKYLDRTIRLYVAYVRAVDQDVRIRVEGGVSEFYSPPPLLKLPGYQLFEAYTAYRGHSGGMITVAVPEGQVDRFVRRVGTRSEYDRSGIRSVLVRGILKRTRSGHYYVVAGKRKELGIRRDDDSLFPSDGKSSQEYPRISNGRLFTGEKGVPVNDVIRLLRRKHYIR